MLFHGIEGDALLRHGDSKDKAAIFAGQEALGDADEEPDRENHDAERKHQGDETVPQDLFQAPIVPGWAPSAASFMPPLRGAPSGSAIT